MTGHGYSLAVLDKIVTAGGEHKSFQRAVRMTKKLAEVDISHMHVSRLTHEIGEELAQLRDHKAQLHRYRQLPCDPNQPAVELACVEFDGGRINTRADEQPRGVHEAGWKESKVACLWRMTGKTFDEDPHPEVPRCFLDKERVAKLVRQMKGRAAGVEADESDEPLTLDERQPAEARSADNDQPRWQPERVFRTCVASLKDIHGFGPLVAAEAQSRGFYQAKRRAFVADGQPANWTLHRLHFPTFTGIADFMHPVSYMYSAAAAVSASAEAHWSQYVAWLTACWQGKVADVVAALEDWSQAHRPPSETKVTDLADDDPRKIVHTAATYLRNNSPRMDYPRYRREGLPMTSTLVESLIKEFNLRVKGTEKFWNRHENDPDSSQGAESILQVRAALLSDDDRLSKHIASRPGSPFVRHRRRLAPTQLPV